MQALSAATLLCLGLVLMMTSWMLVFGPGLKAGLFAGAGAPMLIAGAATDRRRDTMMVFAVGMALGVPWVYMAETC
ncbi:MAG: hypothetical protein F4041_09325 [Acidobacteriia bacterium]|nr:hypothetical protein [Terriglobia bacterium]MYK09826.1 hypothetical protein [Terriglobia bacterium]